MGDIESISELKTVILEQTGEEAQSEVVTCDPNNNCVTVTLWGAKVNRIFPF
jgi:hypothetical protein